MSKLKKVGYVSLGVLLGVSLTVSVPALAATAKTIQAKINSSVSVMVDGEKMKTQPINYQNLNYLPVGEIGRALDAEVSFDKSKNVINIESKEDTAVSGGDSTSTGSTGSTGSGSVTTPDKGTAETTIPTVKAGESITAKGVTVSIDKIEYTNGENIDGIYLPKGFKIFVKITNNASEPLRLSSTFTLDTGKLLLNKQVNGVGNSINMKVNGEQFLGAKITEGQTATGFIYTEFNEDLDIKQIQYAPSFGNTTSHDYIGTWTFE